MYYCLQKFRATGCQKTVSKEHIQLLLNGYGKKPTLCSPNFEKLVSEVMSKYKTPSTAEESYILYLEILNAFENEII